MNKKDKLYTVNKWNKPLFMSNEENNLYWPGGNLLSSKINMPVIVPHVDWSNDRQRAAALGTTKGITEGWGNMANAINPFNSKKGSSLADSDNGILNSIVTGAAGTLGSMAGKAISGGLSSGAGDIIGSLGTTVGGAISTANPLLGSAVTFGTNLVSGAANALFGSKLNKENIANANASIDSTRNNANEVMSANSTDAFMQGAGNVGMVSAFDKDYFGKDGLWSHKVEDIYNDFQNRSNAANLFAVNALATGAQNVGKIQNSDKMRNFTLGYGGLIDKYADGGKLSGVVQTHGGDFSTGLITIGAGGSHESNPNEGVQIGVDNEGIPNLVEEGETIFNDYVHSDRIKMDKEAKKLFHINDKKDYTYAEYSKILEEEIKERPNDPISIAGFKKQMQMLADSQERQKAEMEAKKAKDAFEALSPEEQVAFMQQIQQQDQIANEQAMQQQAMSEQAMQEQQVSPEEAAMMQEQQMAQQAPSEEEILAAQAANVAANGGLLVKAGDIKPNKFAFSGRMKKRYNNDWFLTQARSLGLIGNDDDQITIKDADGKDLTFTYNSKDPELNLSTFNNIYNAYQKKKALETYMKGQRQSKRNALFGDKGMYSLSDDKSKVYKNRVGESDRIGYINSSYTGDLVDGAYKGFISTDEYNKLRDKYDKATGEAKDKLRDELAGYKPINEKAGDFMYDYNGKVIRDLQEGATEDSILDTYNEDYKKGFEWDDKNASALSYPAKLTHSPTSYLRYVPAVGGLVGLVDSWFSKPDYSRATSVINGSKYAPSLITPNYNPTYLTYKPMDIWAGENRLEANARATDRAIMNSSSPGRIAGLVTNGYNTTLGLGNLYRQALEYDDAQRARVATHNSGENKTLAQLDMQAQQANQAALERANYRNYQGLLQGNQMMENIDANRAASRNTNLTNLLTSLGNIGEEAYDTDRLKWLEDTGVLRSDYFNRGKYAACGGKLNKRNKKGGKA